MSDVRGDLDREIQRKLAVAIESASARYRGGTWRYAFALHGGPHPAPLSPAEPHFLNLPVFWLRTPGGETLPLRDDLLMALTACRGVWIYGAAPCVLTTGLPQPSRAPVTRLTVHALICPHHGHGRTSHHDYTELLCHVDAATVPPEQPLVCVVQGSRPRGWPP